MPTERLPMVLRKKRIRLSAVSHRTAGHGVLLAAAVVAGAFGCSAGAPASPVRSQTSAADAGAPFQGDPPSVYVAKAKNILVGLPPTDDEVKSVQANPAQLAS